MTKSSFGKMSQYKVDGESVAEYVIEDFPGKPFLLCHPANIQNESYMSKVIADPDLQNINADTPADIKRVATLYADEVVVGWGNLSECRLDGANDPKCTRAAKIDFLTTLLTDHKMVFLKFTLWVTANSSFFSLDLEEEAKNS